MPSGQGGCEEEMKYSAKALAKLLSPTNMSVLGVSLFPLLKPGLSQSPVTTPSAAHVYGACQRSIAEGLRILGL